MARRAKEAEHPNLAVMRDLKKRRVFSRLGAEDGPECMIRVAWSSAFDDFDQGQGHLVRRGEVTANLGFYPSPPFTDAEMQEITFAAKMQAVKVVRARRRKVKT